MQPHQFYLPERQRFPSGTRSRVRCAAIYGGLLFVLAVGWSPADDPSPPSASAASSASTSDEALPPATASPATAGPATASPATAGPVTGGPIAPGPINPNGSPSASGSPNLPNASGAPNSPNPGDLTPPGNPNPLGTPNSPVPNTPLLPQQAGNAYTPFTLNSALSPTQSPQITTPQLYTTGTTDVSQIASNTGLRQAFSEEPASTGFLSEEQEGGYSFPPIERIRLGPLDLKGAVVASIVSDDNLRTGLGDGNGGKKSDVSYNITPAVLLEYGAHDGQRGFATVVYSPTIQRFFHNSDQDADDQNIAVSAQYPFQRLTLNGSYSYSETSGVNIDTDTRTTQSTNLAQFGGDYVIDDKISLSVQAQEVISKFAGSQGQQDAGVNTGQGSDTSSLNTSLTYRLTDKVTFGPNFNIGVEKPDDSPQQTYEQGTLGVTYVPTEKITLFAQGGVEFRQFDSGYDGSIPVSSSDKTNPIFSAGVGYSPFDSTTLALNASQSVRSSVADSVETVVNTAVEVSATQRFFQRIFLNVSFNYSHEDNSMTSGDVGLIANANQDQMTYRTSLSIAPTAWSSASVYYQYLDNDSDDPGEKYHDNQFGLALSAQF